MRLGDWDVKGTSEFYKHIDIPIEAIIHHPQYYGGNLVNDISIIKLQTPVDLHNRQVV